MKLVFKDTYDEASEWAARFLIKKLNEFKPGPDKYFKLGLSVGPCTLGLYKKLVEFFESGKVTLKFVKTFNTAEYIGIPQTHPQSTHYLMWRHLFKNVDISPSNVFIPDGNAKDLPDECDRFEENIRVNGGINLFITEISEDGQLGYNEPGSSLASHTRVKNLSYERMNNVKAFFENDFNKVPKRAISVGVATVMEAREVLLMITGGNRALALYKGVEESINHMCILSAFQKHEHTVIVCDKAASLELRGKTVEYFKSLDDPLNEVAGDWSNWTAPGGVQWGTVMRDSKIRSYK